MPADIRPRPGRGAARSGSTDARWRGGWRTDGRCRLRDRRPR
jgi:nitrate reductase beta subunit